MGMSSNWLDPFTLSIPSMPFSSGMSFRPSIPFIPFMSTKPSSRSMAAGPASLVPSMGTSPLLSGRWARKESFSAGDTTIAGASGCAVADEEEDEPGAASTIGSSIV